MSVKKQSGGSSISTKLKYQLYEGAVQSPESDVVLFDRMYREINNRVPLIFREDFCGTFKISCEWVKGGERREALALDIDEEPLEQGRRYSMKGLSASQKKRIFPQNANVLYPPKRKVDIVSVCNFSFYTFQERTIFMNYLEACRSSLKKNGLLILELVGGPGFVNTPRREQRTIKYEEGPNKGMKWFTYYWEQHSFNPVTRRGLYYIHFTLNDGTKIKRAFSYDWRVWQPAEVRDCINEAGFRKSYVYWDIADADEDDNYVMTEEADNDDTWIGYLVGQK